MLAALSHSPGRVFLQAPNVCETAVLQDGSEVSPDHGVGESTVTKDNDAVTNRGEFVIPVGNAKGQQLDGLPVLERPFSNTRWYGVGS